MNLALGSRSASAATALASMAGDKAPEKAEKADKDGKQDMEAPTAQPFLRPLFGSGRDGNDPL